MYSYDPIKGVGYNGVGEPLEQQDLSKLKYETLEVRDQDRAWHASLHSADELRNTRGARILDTLGSIAGNDGDLTGRGGVEGLQDYFRNR